jgi:ketosteroid isomerase-like protein
MTTVETVRQVFSANQRFYKAFEGLDIQRMTAVWRQDTGVQCIHPGWPRLVGWPAVRDSWVRIFNNTRSMKFQIADTQITVQGAVAWVICLEQITMLIDDEEQQTQVLATNIFEQQDNPSEGSRWLMVHHHGSPVFQRLAGGDPARADDQPDG